MPNEEQDDLGEYLMETAARGKLILDRTMAAREEEKEKKMNLIEITLARAERDAEDVDILALEIIEYLKQEHGTISLEKGWKALDRAQDHLKRARDYLYHTTRISGSIWLREALHA